MKTYKTQKRSHFLNGTLDQTGYYVFRVTRKTQTSLQSVRLYAYKKLMES